MCLEGDCDCAMIARACSLVHVWVCPSIGPGGTLTAGNNGVAMQCLVGHGALGKTPTVGSVPLPSECRTGVPMRRVGYVQPPNQ